MQLQAGYILEGLPRLYSGRERESVEALLKNLSYFDLDTCGQKLVRRIDDPFVYVVHNLITRGLPTIAPTFIEEIISATFLNSKKTVDKRGQISYDFINDELKDDIYRALHVVDPRLDLEKLKKVIKFDGDPEADLKKKFIFETLPAYIGDYIVQLVGLDRNFGSILRQYSLSEYYKAKRKVLLDKAVDFVLEVPYAETNQFRGMAIELEKKLLEDEQIMDLDQRSWFLSQIGWGEIFYLKQSDFYSNTVDYTRLQEFSYNQFFEYIRKNYERPLYSNSYGLDALQLALSPFEIARIQRVLIEYILSGVLDLDARQWNIAFIERDVPGAFLAVQDLAMRFNNLYELSGVRRKFPEVKLEIFYHEEFESAALNILYQGDKFLIEDFDKKRNYDLVIDSSVLRYDGLDEGRIETSSPNLAIVRSSRYINSSRSFLTGDKLKYKSFVVNDTLSHEQITGAETARESFIYFVKDVFRRQSLSEEQIKTLSLLLSGNNTLAHFPFTGEKTLLYQIAALLQPGLTLVLEPLLVSLFDQLERIKAFRIDAIAHCCVNYGYVYTLEQQKEIITKGGALLVFATGDDLHTNELRQIFKLLRKNAIYFTLVVVDQAEAMSPWSSSFNYAYYVVNRNIETFLPFVKPPLVLALSSGMDYDAQTDVTSSLGISDSNIVRGSYELDKLKLKFHFSDSEQIVEYRKLKPQEIEQAKLKYVSDNKLLARGSLVYAHHPSNVYDGLSSTDLPDNVGVFEDSPRTEFYSLVPYHTRTSYNNFKRFVQAEVDMLIANRNIAYGLDKKDIHSLILLSLPVGVEDFIKLLHRVGRDLKPADIDFVLSRVQVVYDEQKYTVSDHEVLQLKQNRQIYYDELESSKIWATCRGNLKKDMALADEILNSLEAREDTLEDLLIRRVRQVFGLWVSFDYQPVENPTKLYVYESGDLIGIIDFENNTIDNQAEAFRKEIADDLLAFVDGEIRSFVGNPRDIFSVIKDSLTHSQESLLQRLISMTEGGKASMTIDFSNNVSAQIAELVGKDKFSQREIEEIYSHSSGFRDFRDVLLDKLDRRFFKKNEDKIRELYNAMRSFEDTYRLVYYLVVIGVVDDYLIDFRNQLFVLQLNKLSDDQFINRVYKRISAFVSREKAMEVFQKVPGFIGGSFVHKVLNYWINFEYSYIRQRIEDYITELMRVIRAMDSDQDIDNWKFVLSHYLDAKYIVDFREKKEAEKENWIKIIDYFIQKVGIFKSNILHLHRTAEILLKKDRQDYVALMLRGWASLLISSDNETVSRALDDIAMSLNMWKKQSDVGAEEFISWIDSLLVTLENYNFELKTRVEKLFHLKIFTTWLKDFNNHFVDLT